MNNSKIAKSSEEKIYDACKKIKKDTYPVTLSIRDIPSHQNSYHLKAIADMNYYMF